MRLKLTCIWLVLLLGALALSCGKDSVTSSDEQTGLLKVSLTDAPAAFEAVNITFAGISAHIDGEWVQVRKDDPITVNLLEWNNGKSMVLGQADLPAGNYTQIRLMISDAEVTVSGVVHKVTVPSGAQTGLKLVAEFTVEAGSTYELVLDFDAQRSIVSQGPPGQPIRYLLKPTVRVVPKATTGSISGLLADAQHVPIAYAIAAGDTLTSTRADDSGFFRLAFLPPGAYTVSVQDTLSRNYVENDVEVVAGSDSDLGTITLQ